MHTLIGLLVVLLAGGALSAFAAAVFVKGVPGVGTGVAMTISIAIAIGYLMASCFFRWGPADGAVKPRLVFPGVVAIVSVISAFIGLGPVLGWAYGASLVPAHAGMSGWFLGIIASTVVIALAARLIDSLVTAKRSIALSNADVEPARTGSALRMTSWDVIASRAAGVILLLLLMIGQAVVGPVIFRRFGPDASYQTAIASLVRSIVVFLPLATVAGITLERLTRGRALRRRWIAALLVLIALVAICEVRYRYGDARDSEQARWWMEHRSLGR